MPTCPPRYRGAPPVQPETRPAQAYDRQRGSAASRGYDRTWQRLRRLVLTDEPLCRHCLAAGRVQPAIEVHHLVAVRIRPDLRLVRSNLAALCKPCHSAETARGR